MLANAAEVVAAVLAIAITVVAIVVELAANRYSHRITQLFVRNPVNLSVIAFAQLVQDYEPLRSRLSRSWFRVDTDLATTRTSSPWTGVFATKSPTSGCGSR